MISKQFTPAPIVGVEAKPGVACQDRTEWENEMLLHVWAAGLHDEANCMEDALRENRALKAQLRR